MLQFAGFSQSQHILILSLQKLVMCYNKRCLSEIGKMHEQDCNARIISLIPE